MENQELLNHINQVYECEYNIYQIDQLNSSINGLRKMELAPPDKSYYKRRSLIGLFFQWLIRLFIPVSVIAIILSITHLLDNFLQTPPGIFIDECFEKALKWIESTLASVNLELNTNNFFHALIYLLIILLLFTIPFAIFFAVINWLHDGHVSHKSKRKMKARVRKYKKDTMANEKYNAMLDEQISENNKTKGQWQQALKLLYEKNIIKPRYQNLAAVSALKGYVEDEICSKLEGPDGAYAQYIEDLRIGRICDSMKDLESKMNQGFRNIQSSQQQMMMRMDDDLRQRNDMQMKMESRIGEISKHLTDANKNADKINSSLSKMGKDLHDVADHYRYVDYGRYNIHL